MEAIITGGRMYASERPQGRKSHQAHQTAFRCSGCGGGSRGRLEGNLLGGAGVEGLGEVLVGCGDYRCG